MSDWGLRIATTSAEREDAFAVRERVFVEGQGIDPDLEYDEHDETATHVVAYDGETPVGAGRFRAYGDDSGDERETIKIERVAVDSEVRGEGLGRALMEAVHDAARERGYERAYLHAQVRVRRFYERLGYEAVSEAFEEAGIPHVAMERAL